MYNLTMVKISSPDLSYKANSGVLRAYCFNFSRFSKPAERYFADLHCPSGDDRASRRNAQLTYSVRNISQ